MIQPAEVSSEHLGQLAGMYAHAGFLYKTDPAASPRKLAKARRFIKKQYSGVIGALPPEIMPWFDASVSNEALFAFLKGCSDEIELRFDAERREFEALIAPLSEELRAALRQLKELEFGFEIRQAGDQVEVLLDDTTAYRRYLCLSGAEALSQDIISDYVSGIKLTRQEETEEFCLTITPEDRDPIVLTFSGASVRTECYDCTDDLSWYQNPWSFLTSISISLCMKAELPENHCNAAETALLPLCREIADLDHWDTGKQRASFPVLRALAEQYGCRKVLPMLTRLEEEEYQSDKYFAAARKLTALLCRQEYEPLFRKIFRRLQASQAEYPRKAETLCQPELLQRTRDKITELLTRQGYSGAYPDFEKTAPVRGIRLEEAYGLTYWVCSEKRVLSRIHCAESPCPDGSLAVTFSCGTALLRKDEAPCDIYGCMFNANGRRFFRFTRCVLPAEEDDQLDRFAAIAVKKAELQKLDKEEKTLYYGPAFPGWGLFWAIFILGGGFFAIAMTLSMMLLAVVSALIFGQPEAIGSMLTEIPWLHCLAFCWISFGGVMGIITLLAARK